MQYINSFWVGGLICVARGVIKGIQEHGILGIITGGTEAAAGGIGASVLFGFLAALIFKPKSKS